MPSPVIPDEGRIRIWRNKRFERETPDFGKFDRVSKPRTDRNKNSWPEGRPDFLQFVLYKEKYRHGLLLRKTF
jgi:hypothetical protein